MNGFRLNGLLWVIDPTGHYTKLNVPPQNLVEAIGIIPSFIQEEECVDTHAMALEAYGMGNAVIDGGIIKENGIYVYPGDPELIPFTYVKAGGYDIYTYEYGIISFVMEDEEEPDGYQTYIHRFD